MLFTYKAVTQTGEQTHGEIDAISVDAAIDLLQKNGLVLSEINAKDDGGSSWKHISFFNHISNKDIVILSRQMATLFSAQVSALRIFRLVGGQVENTTLQRHLLDIADDIQGGSSISASLARHPDVFSSFYTNMVRAGEESGKLDQVFGYLADYLDRTYEVTSKAKNALVYPAFVILTFVGVMILMLTVIIPKISVMLVESGQEIPIYTKIVLGISNIFVHYGLFFAIGAVLAGFALWKYNQTDEGRLQIDTLKLEVPYLGSLYRKLFLSRIADNLNTMITAGIPILRALEITSSVVDNRLYQLIIERTLMEVKGGSSLSKSFGNAPEIPGIMVQMIKVGEETGEVGNILRTLAKFYEREVTNAVDTLVGLIEPIMIVSLGVGVGILLAAVLMPIYNIASAT
jgi:type II secretory pathway component PulF